LDVICEDVTFVNVNHKLASKSRKIKINEKQNKMKKFYVIFALFALISLTVTAQPQLTWRFNNVEVINAGTPSPKLQFDVEVMANAGGSYHRDLQIYFDYNTLGFGSNIVANGKITYTPLTLMDATKYVVVNMADNTPSKFAVITEAINEMTQPGSATYYKEVLLNSYQGVLRFTIDISGLGQTAGIAFDAALMNGGQYYQSTSNTNPIKYAETGIYFNDLSTFMLSSLYGNIVYANAGAAPMANCTVTVMNGAIPVGTALTDVNGDYRYSNIGNGTYTLTTTCSEPWVNETTVGDISMVIDHILGTPLTDVYFLAADVTNDASCDVGDIALMIDNILGTLIGYPASAPWVFVTQTVNVSGGMGVKNYNGLLAGDPDGSH
jgi:hypothetical protein